MSSTSPGGGEVPVREGEREDGRVCHHDLKVDLKGKRKRDLLSTAVGGRKGQGDSPPPRRKE